MDYNYDSIRRIISPENDKGDALQRRPCLSTPGEGEPHLHSIYGM